MRWAGADVARVLGFDETGALAPGKLADMAILDFSPPVIAACTTRCQGQSRVPRSCAVSWSEASW